MPTLNKAIMLGSILFGTFHALGQGTVNFFNGWPPGGTLDQYTIVNAPFYDNQGVYLAGPRYDAQLYEGLILSTLSPQYVPVPFLTGGYFDGGDVSLSGISFEAYAYLQVRAWDATRGATYAQALAAGAWTRLSNTLFLQTGGGGLPPTLAADLVGLKFIPAPELSSVAMALIGLVGFLHSYRRRD